eukprot:gene54-12872_t
MSIFEYNGAAIVAMAGKDCVAIASDLRFGVQLQTITTDTPKIHKINDKLVLGLSGLATDAQTLLQKLQFRVNMYKLREERDIKPTTFGHLVSAVLYEKRFGPYMAGPVIAGLEEDGTPYLCGMDSIGAMETAKDFMVQSSTETGVSSSSLSEDQERLEQHTADQTHISSLSPNPLLASVIRSGIMQKTEFNTQALHVRLPHTTYLSQAM